MVVEIIPTVVVHMMSGILQSGYISDAVNILLRNAVSLYAPPSLALIPSKQCVHFYERNLVCMSAVSVPVTSERYCSLTEKAGSSMTLTLEIARQHISEGKTLRQQVKIATSRFII